MRRNSELQSGIRRVPFEPPAFILGQGRSGTTLLSSILNRHSEICVTPETHFFQLIARYPGGEDELARDWPQSLSFVVSRMDPTPDWKPSSEEIIRGLPPGAAKNYPGTKALFMAIGEDIAATRGKKLWIEKTPKHVWRLGTIRRLFPDARIIHLVRDGRDTAESQGRMVWTLDSAVPYLLEWRKIMDLVDTQLRLDENLIEVRYEQLVTKPKIEMRRLCAFLGVDFTPRILVPDGNESDLIEIGQFHKEQIKEPITNANIARWKRQYGEQEHRLAGAIIGLGLERRGYEVALPDSERRIAVNVAYDLAAIQYRAGYGELLEALFQNSAPLVVERVLAINEWEGHEPPKIWVTGEPFPGSELEHSRRTKVLPYLLGLRRKLTRLQDCRLIWFYHGDQKRSCAWPLKLRIERQVARRACAIVCPSDETPRSDLAKLLQVAPEKFFYLTSTLNVDLARCLEIDSTFKGAT